jgi:hypothetical protein
MGKSNDSAASIQFWKVIEAKAKLAISSIEHAKHTGSDVVALHAEGLADLQNHIGLAGDEMTARQTSDAAKVNIYPGRHLSLGK